MKLSNNLVSCVSFKRFMPLAIASTLLSPSVGVLAQGAMLEEITITANRRAESLQDSSLVINAFDSEDLFSQGITNALELSRITPGLQVGNAGPQLQVYIRGVGAQTGTIIGSPAVSVNKNSVYLARNQQAGAAFYDLARVEVLKGPQGTLYGRNTTAGAVNLITNGPNLDGVSGYASLDVGNYSKIQFEGAANIPLSDTFAIRASAFTLDRDGYLSDDSMDGDHWSGRLQGLWEPNEDVSLRIEGQYSDYDQKSIGGFSYFGAPDPWEAIVSDGANAILARDPRVPAIFDLKEDDTFQLLEVWDVSSTLVWNTDIAAVTAIASYQEMESSYLSHSGPRFSQEDLINPGNGETSESGSLEIRLSNETDSLKWVAGANVWYEDQYSPTFINQGFGQRTFIQTAFENESLGVFADFSYSISDELRLLAGIRYSEDDIAQTQFDRYSVYPSGPCNDAMGTIIDFPSGVRLCETPSLDADSDSYDSTDGKLGLEYDVSEDSMVFATVSTGYKAGGFSNAVFDPYDPEELTAYEVGFRNLFMDGRLQVNGDIFYWDYTDRQEFVVGPDDLGITGQFVLNTGESTSKGVNLDVQFAATENDLITFAVEYLQAEYDSFSYTRGVPYGGECPTTLLNAPFPAPVLIDCSGFETPRSPEWSGNASYTRTFNLDAGTLDASVDVSYKDQVWTTSDFLAEQRVPSLMSINANLTYNSADGQYTIVGYATNINEEATYSAGLAHTQIPDLVGLAVTPPRTYGVRVRYNF